MKLPAVFSVTVAVYVPSPLSCAGIILTTGFPLTCKNETVAPPVTHLFPALSKVVNVMVTLLPAVTLDADVLIIDFPVLGGPIVTLTGAASDVSDFPPMNPTIELDPASVPVKSAV